MNWCGIALPAGIPAPSGVPCPENIDTSGINIDTSGINTDTWGISGPHFLALYGAIGAGVLVLMFLIRAWLRSSQSSTGVGEPSLDPYEIAMLKGGEKLALAAAVCRLKEAGTVEVDASGRSLQLAGPLQERADALERWAYDAIETAPAKGSALLDKRRADPALAPIRAGLEAHGLLLSKRRRSLIRLQLLWFVPVLGLGVARVIAGSNNGKPIGDLAALIGIGLCAVVLVTSPPFTSWAGARLLKRVKQDASSLGSYGFAADVALSGYTALWAADATLAGALGLSQASGGYGGGGGGGGCGGGGCGG